MLQISGELDLTTGDSPVDGLNALAIDNSSQNGSGLKTENSRRSLYLPIIRNELPGFLVTFDFADPDIVTGRRPQTNVPAQAMYLINNAFVREQAAKVAQQQLEQVTPTHAVSVPEVATAPQVAATAEAVDTVRLVVEALFRRILCRQPTDTESAAIVDHVSRRISETPNAQAAVWTEVVQTLFASTAFRLLE